MPAKQYRGFSIVIHDVEKTSHVNKGTVEAQMSKIPATQWVIAQEPYTHQEGSHIHIFYRCDKRTFPSQLKFWKDWVKSDDCRVQVDVMLGSMEQACRYLQPGNSDKFKYYDGAGVKVYNVIEQEELRYETLLSRYPGAMLIDPIFWWVDCQLWVQGKCIQHITEEYLDRQWDIITLYTRRCRRPEKAPGLPICRRPKD
jgi:hypothetical protein